ncbi:MAG: flagellar assembly protein FliW [Candidatus Brocadiaceae bacterium]|nr:flagellar assembly protein FliW [Candidatus Brocadiaceae bacterium]
MEEKSLIKLRTEKLGELNIKTEDIITFDEGILGYEDYKQYVIVNFEECRPFEWLICVEDPMIAFPIINPLPLFTDYNPLDSVEEVQSLHIEDRGDVETFCIVTLGEDPAQVTINLKGPILVNMGNNKGKQVVLTEDYYNLHHPLVKT